MAISSVLAYLLCILPGLFCPPAALADELPLQLPEFSKATADYLAWVDQSITTIEAEVVIEIFDGTTKDRDIIVHQYMNGRCFRCDQIVKLVAERKPRSKESVLYDGMSTYNFDCLTGVMYVKAGRQPFGALAPCPLFFGLTDILAPRQESENADKEDRSWGVTLRDVKANHGKLALASEIVNAPGGGVDAPWPIKGYPNLILHHIIQTTEGRPACPSSIREYYDNHVTSETKETAQVTITATTPVTVAGHTITLAKTYERTMAGGKMREVFQLRKMIINQPLDADCFTPDVSMATQIYDYDKKGFTVDHR